MAKIFIVVPEAPIEEAVQLKAGRTLGSGGIRLAPCRAIEQMSMRGAWGSK